MTFPSSVPHPYPRSPLPPPPTVWVQPSSRFATDVTAPPTMGKYSGQKKYSLATSNNSSKMSIVERVHGTLSSSPTAPWCPARSSAQAATSLRSTLAHSHVLPLLKYERRLPYPPQMLSPSCACIHRGRSQRLSHVQWRRTQGLETQDARTDFAI